LTFNSSPWTPGILTLERKTERESDNEAKSVKKQA